MWDRRSWTAVLTVVVIVVLVLASGVLVQRALAPNVPSQLAGCNTATAITPHRFIGPPPMCITANEKLEATVTTSQGSFVILLHPEVAPVTVNNFVVLAIHGYYNGLTFWKSEDWVVQGGDPQGNGTGGPGYNLPDEPSNTPWGLGAVGMARVPGGAVNGSQFFVQKAAWPAPGPTAAYNRFGTVISGMSAVQALGVTDTITSVTIKVD